MIDSFRSSLSSKSVEPLICLQIWLMEDDICCMEDEPCIEDMDHSMKILKEVMTTHYCMSSTFVQFCL